MARRIIAGSSLIIIGLLAALWWVKQRQTLAVERPPLAAPDRGLSPAIDREPTHFTGVLFARHQVDLTSMVDAHIETMEAKLGERLHQGDVVATLDAASLRGELAAAVAVVRAAQAEAQAAKVEHAAAVDRRERTERVPDGVSGEERANASYQEKLSASRLAAGRARVGEAVAKVDELRVLIEHSAILAPFDGVVAARYVDPGALVGPGKPIARLISDDDLWVRFAVPEQDAGTVKVGSCVAVAVGSSGRSAPGRVEMVAPQVDTQLRLLVAEARLILPRDEAHPQAGLAAAVEVVGCAGN